MSFPSPWINREPIREELFSAERLEQHARSLARAQTVTSKVIRGNPLAGRLLNNGAILLDAFQSVVKALEDGRTITPAAEWLIDNFHLVEKQIRELRSDLPPGYYRQLPKLADGPFANYPRVFGMTWAFVAHTDSRFDPALLVNYVRAYQEVQPLTIGELWAVSITLRIVLIENLRRLGQQIMDGRAARQQADIFADRLLGLGGYAAEPIAAVLADHKRDNLPDAFAVQLFHRLREQDPRVTPALRWLDEHLATQDMTADAVVGDVHRRQGAANVTVRNIITSFRLIADVDWKELFERTSLVDATLAADTSFREMDFPTRNLYRSAIEALARGSKRTEIDIARDAVLAAERAKENMPANARSRQQDPGYYLFAEGRRDFEVKIGFNQSFHHWRARLARSVGIGSYATLVAGVTALLLALPLYLLASAGIRGAHLWLLAGLGALPAVDAAIALVNRIAAFAFPATLLPALELKDGVPAHLRTLVAVPTLLTTREAIDEQVEKLEIHHLASDEGDLHFALLSDWTDAATEHAEGDQDLLAAAAAGIARLNDLYPPGPGGARFALLHRRRVWSESEDRWIGWERKRGKLHELNRLLRGATDTTFISLIGETPAFPPDVRYVVTLDSDTRLPRDTVRRLIGKMAHPLNWPRFDAASQRVVEGYAVLQPRVTPSLPVGQEGSLFQQIFSSLSGIDPYASAVSDLYQDMFGEGSYAGKGIYDVDAFEASLAGRMPESAILSHDLFEGIFARAGFASDVEVVEEFPARYDVGAIRHHRWARGDWQLLPWILGRRPTKSTLNRAASAIPAVGRWKMVDNLRRTLSAPAAIAALLIGWCLPIHDALIWAAFVLSTIVLPTLIPVIAAIPSRRQGIPILSHLRALRRDGRLAFALSALTITFLAHQAWLMADAIGRTLWRLLISRRHLLEWVPAAQAMSGRRLDIFGFFQKMIGAPFIAAIAVTSAVVSAQGTWIPASVVAVFWAISPIVARWVSLPPRTTGRARLSDKDARVLRLTARRTWRFFETFVTPADRMLPPDNFQEDPAPVLAHRTSPTNIGLYLLSVVSAHDFGWIGTGVAIERLEATLATMSDMARFRGHFYNWYDTQDLRPLDPKYVSSVDSGNLLGHLIALANACREWRSRAIQITPRIAGIADAVDLLQEASAALRDGRLTQTVTWRQAEGVLEGLRGALNSPPPSLDSLAPWLSDLAAQAETMADISGALAIERGDDAAADMQFWAKAVQGAIAAHRHDLSASVDGAGTCDERLSAIEASARAMAMAMEFGFLLDEERKLLSIGYLVPEGALDSNCYDLLASEARLASFMAIAKGDVPARHWFRLGRSVTPVANRAALISWSGSMFEYLMPSLVMRAPAGSLLEQTNRSIVRRQIDYAGSLNIPWGISESAYNARDLEFTYQYSNFGVPGLGVKRGLGENLVVAPYATALATMVDPQAATTNFARLTSAGVRGRYGFYEAVDFTPARVPTHSRCVIVRAYMAHHQGMTIVALADALFDGVMRTRFHAEPIVQATELLLQERSPREVPKSHAWAADVKLAANNRDAGHLAGRRYTSAHQVVPVTHLLSNGRYSTMITAAGSGYSRWRDIAVTRWREDATCDDYGSYIFLRDVQTGQAWSAGFQSSGAEPDAYHVAFDEGRAEITRRDGSLSTTLEVILSPEDDAEVRRISISNNGSRVREIELTSYAELALAPHAADVAHPAFSKLFVETQYLSNVGAIVATRRKRAPTDAEIWAAHLSVVDGESILLPEFETDRARFVGRGHSVRNPVAMIDGRPLSNTVGTVLDPIFALRRRLRIQPGSTARVSFWTMLAPTRAALLGCIDKHRESTAFSRASTLAWTQAQVQLHHVGITAGEAGLFQRLAGHVIYAATTLRPTSDTIARGAGAQQGLWAQSISGDLPIVLLRISHIEDILVARELLQAREYWRLKQLAVDLVIINERRASYIQDLQIALETMVRVSQSAPQAGGDAPRGGVFVLRADLVPDETQALLVSSARVVLVAHRGSLFDQLERIVESTTAGHALPKLPAPPDLQSLHAPSDLEFFNGTGGFAANGSEYVTILGPGQATPAPWINVIANPTFGFQVSSEGSGYTWSSNSRENQLSPWSNDPVTDRPGEALYLRDEDTGDVWSPTALPIRIPERTYVAHHGRGYSRFKGLGYGIASDLVQYVPIDAPIKVSRLVLHNRSSRTRTLSVTAYVEWVLGPSRSVTRPFVMTEMDSETGAMFARNPWSRAFGAQVAFLDLSGKQTEWSGDRQEFIGRNGTLEDPAALGRTIALSNKVGAGFDPAGVMRTHVTIPPDGRVEIVVFLGEAGTAGEAHDLIKRYRVANLDEVEADIASFWKGVLGSVQVRTPDRAMDIMLNGWLLYQTLACRVWARSAFYQASGAYGFRDQLQDGTALATSCPQLTRDHILRAAGRQFSEGDVQHWWLPHSGEGVRTRISDDRIWLVYCVSHYVTTTGDAGVLDEVVPYLHGQRLLEGDHDSFFQPVAAEHSGSLFEHCIRALEQSLALGPHGLPLIGTGDWNDGMNRVGEKGTGESVWLGWFLHAAIGAFAPIAEGKGCAVHAATWRAHAHALQIALEQEAWDGGWYRRGFFDDGTPFGSAASQECRIDSIAQSWAVLSGAAQQDRAEQAMAAFERELIKDGLSLLLTPPFDKTHLDPGYIKGYPPGIRENGGQYTHAALWSVMAQAALGEGDKAVALFSLLNPINHARSRADVHRYKVEPYVVAADIYASPQHMGRGGWTWYTGAAGWMQRAGIESILGVRLQGAELHIDPCIPKSWPGFEITVRYRSTSYLVIVENPAGVSQGIAAATLDHEAVVVVARPLSIPLDDDGILHRVHVKLGVRADD